MGWAGLDLAYFTIRAYADEEERQCALVGVIMSSKHISDVRAALKYCNGWLLEIFDCV
jgi:hypothetical protein